MMDSILSNRLKENQKMNFENMNKTDDEINQLANKNLSSMEKLVDKDIFSGELEKKSQEKSKDFTHEYIYESAAKQVSSINYKVIAEIKQYGKANLTEQDKKAINKSKNKGKIEILAENKAAEASLDKEGQREKAAMEEYKKEVNEMADINTVREMESLEEYTNGLLKYIKNEDSTYKKYVKNALKHITDEEKRKKKQKDVHSRMIYGAIPFIKQYKKGWFGRKYTLDGQRIKTKKGELTPDEYNKKILKTLCLETDKDQGLDDKTLEKNRKEKAETLTMLTKELLNTKLDTTMLTDDYLSKHIVEIQGLADKLNAFEVLYGQNKWFFYGKDGKDLKVSDAADPAFMGMIENRIFKVSERLNEFLGVHYRAHGMKRRTAGSVDGKSKATAFFDAEGFPIGELPQEGKLEDVLRLRKYREEQIYGFGFNFEVVNTKKMSAVDLKIYQDRVRRERTYYSIQMGAMKDYVDQYNTDAQKFVSNEVNKQISGEMQKQKDAAHKEFEANKEDNLKQNIRELPYERLADGLVGGINLGDIRKVISKDPAMYASFAPEIDHVYAKLYASARLSAELNARKRALADKLKNEKGFEYKTKNQYISFVNNMMTQDMKQQAERERDEINKKVEVLKYNMTMCSDVIKYLMRGAVATGDKKKTEEINSFLKKEKLEYIFEMDKINKFDKLFDDTIEVVKDRIYKKDTGKDRVKEPKQERLLTGRQRALRIQRVRLHHKKVQDTKNAGYGAVSLAPKNAISALAKVAQMSISELGKFNFKGEIPVGKGKNGGENIAFIYLEEYIHKIMTDHKDSPYKKKQLYDTGFMSDLLNTLIDTHYLPKGYPFSQFMYSMQIKCELLAEHYFKSDALFVKQNFDRYGFVDQGAFDKLSAEESSEMLKIITDKYETAKAEYEKVKNLKDDNPVKKMRQDDLALLKEYREIVAVDVDIKQTDKKYDEFNEELFETKLKERIRAARIKDYKASRFFNADGKYVDLVDLGEEKAFKELISKEWPPKEMKEKRDANPRAKMDEKATQATLEIQANKMISIPIDQNLVKLLNNLELNREGKDLAVGNAINGDNIKKAVEYALVIQSFESICLEDINDEYRSQIDKDMRTLLNKPENAKLKKTLNARFQTLTPFYKAVRSYMESYGFIGISFSHNLSYAGQNLDAEKKKRAQQDMAKRIAETNQSIKNLEITIDNFEKNGGEEGLIKDQTEKLFERIYVAGEKLSINEMDKWKAKVEEMTKKGYFKNETENEKWLRFAAKTILEDWPYSFERFFSRRILKDTGKALTVTLENYGGKDATRLVDGAKSAQISEIITKYDIYTCTALGQEDMKNFDRILKNNGYDTRKIKVFMRPVNVNGANLPAEARDIVHRKANVDIMNVFRNRIENGEADFEGELNWLAQIGEFMNTVLNFEITPAMIEEKYISEHFEELYLKARQIEACKEIYEKNKEALMGPDSYLFNDGKMKLKNVFETKSNNLFVKFSNMIDAYARMHFVGDNGSFDIGLTNKEINSMGVNTGKDATVNQQDMLMKMVNVKKDRREEFEKCRDQVGVEMRRRDLAANIQKADKINNTLNAINITGQDKIFKMVYKEGFAGNLRDVNLFIQDDNLSLYVQKYNEAKERQPQENMAAIELVKQDEQYTREMRELLQKSKEQTEKEGKTSEELQKKIAELNAKIIDLNKQITEHRDEAAYQGKRIVRYKEAIESYQIVNKRIFDSYNNCHDEKGNLISSKVVATPEELKQGISHTVDLKGEFYYFHAQLAGSMRKLYEDFKVEYTKHKKDKEKSKLLDRQSLAKRMLQPDWANKFRDLKKLDLYMGLLEQDSKHFKAKKDPFLTIIKKTNNKNAEDLAAIRKKKKAETKDVKDAEIKAKVSSNVWYMLNDALEDKELISTLHDYVREINATIAMHGVTIEGQILDTDIQSKTNGAYTEEEILNIVHENEERQRKVAKNIEEANKK